MLGIEAPLPLGEMPALPESCRCCVDPSEGEDIAADYGSLGLTLRCHPLARPHGRYSGSPAAGARAAGLVITRQRPGTATGVVFLTLEDETGPLNVAASSSASAASCSERG